MLDLFLSCPLYYKLPSCPSARLRRIYYDLHPIQALKGLAQVKTKRIAGR